MEEGKRGKIGTTVIAELWDAPSLSWLPWMRISHPRHSLLFQRERGWRFPLVENARSPSLKWCLLGWVWAGVYGMPAKLSNQCLNAIVTENRYCV